MLSSYLSSSTHASGVASREGPRFVKHSESTQLLLRVMLKTSLILPEEWEALAAAVREQLERQPDRLSLLNALVEHKLLTEYQADRIFAGQRHGLVLGNYRVLGRLGAGSMGIVFQAEHVRLRRLAAIKVLPLTHGGDPQLLPRFFAEMRVIAQLQHPNIVAAIDAGEVRSDHPEEPVLHYFVMEYVPGQDLESYIGDQGPLAPARACDLIYQVASALGEAHKHHLIHRDIKPSNILVTPEDQAKLLDFGLARQFAYRLTEPGGVLGTLDYMAPEQAQDAHTVDIRADIYGLGGTLFWCLTGRLPFPPQGSIDRDLAYRLTQAPPAVRSLCPHVPTGLEAVVTRMLARDPNDRYPTPQAVMRALLSFVKPESREQILVTRSPAPAAGRTAEISSETPGAKIHQVLIVDDEAEIRTLCQCALQAEGIHCDEAARGATALEVIHTKPYDLVLLDMYMPDITGLEILRKWREAPPYPHLKVIMFSGRALGDEMAQMMQAGADDYLTKPFSLVQLTARINAALRLKDAQDRSALLNAHMLTVNTELERMLTSRDSDLVHARNALVLALAKLVEHRHTETGAHLARVQRYCRCLAEATAALPAFAGQIDPAFIEMLECCAPLHDIGKLSLPDSILLKPGRLEPDERILMQSHTITGAEILSEVARQHGSAMAFLRMAIDIARHHHERWDGTGYPDRLAGNAIPLSARLVAICDVYDALRSCRVYKPSLAHKATLQVMYGTAPGQFDPAILHAFENCAPQFDRIYHDVTSCRSEP